MWVKGKTINAVGLYVLLFKGIGSWSGLIERRGKCGGPEVNLADGCWPLPRMMFEHKVVRRGRMTQPWRSR